MQHLPWHHFYHCVERYRGDHKIKEFKCSDHFRVMAFAQLTRRESLRDIEVCLRAIRHRLYHMGIHSSVSRNNLSNANETRDWRIYADFAQILISDARKLYAHEELAVDLDAAIYALDSTTIDLCLSMFPWAHFRKNKGAVKMHTLLNLRGSIPEFIHISDGKLHDVNILDQLIPVPGAFYLLDRGYLDFKRLHDIHIGQSFFVTRAKDNFVFRRRYSHPADRGIGIVCDQTVMLTIPHSAGGYPDPLRRVLFRDPDDHSELVFLTNNFTLPALTITQLYKARWTIESFFKWIKQHLRIKAFYGTSDNAVKTQIWIAISTYLLVAILKKRLSIEQPLYTILQVLDFCILEKTPILQALQSRDDQRETPPDHNQLMLYD
jgi:hypothetical protein